MKTLYFRIVAMTMLIILGSSVLSFLLSNLYYQSFVKEYNEQKLMSLADDVVREYEAHPTLDLAEYLNTIANLSYQLYVVDPQGHGALYGAPFRDSTIDPAIVQQVQSGHRYHGIMTYKHGLFVTGFFRNTLENSVGVPLHVQNQTYALFLRPNIERMFGEVQILLTMLLVITFMLSLLFLVVFTRFLVNPIKRLTQATKQIAEGQFELKLESNRQDEIGDLARHFSRMAGELKKLEAMRQEFVSNVSHEIQSPLASIQGFSQALRTEDMPPEEQDAYLAIIETESRRLSSLSQQLLTLASLDKEATTFDKMSYRLDEQIREIVLLLEWQWQEKQLHLEVELPDVTVNLDRQLMHLVWINLLTNAIKFTPEHGTISVQLQEGEQDVRVTVRDTGRGIPTDELPRIFDRFYKGDKARNRTQAGTGLGLAIVQKIIKLHRGAVHVESELGVGTSFFITLPRL